MKHKGWLQAGLMVSAGLLIGACTPKTHVSKRHGVPEWRMFAQQIRAEQPEGMVPIDSSDAARIMSTYAAYPYRSTKVQTGSSSAGGGQAAPSLGLSMASR